jgi:transcriptional regulator with XRE-family HTH domain
MTPGVVIAEARRRAGISQTELARRMNTSQPTVARLEASGTDPRWSTVERALRALGEEIHLTAVPRELPQVDEDQIRFYLGLTPGERLARFQREYDLTREALLNAGS